MTFFHVPKVQSTAVRTLQALLIHEAQCGGVAQSHWLTTHRVEQGAQGPCIGAGRLLTEADKRALIDALNGTLPIEEFTLLPPHVLAIGTSKIAWYVPGKVQSMYFNTRGRLFSLKVPWPTLVFLVVDRRLSVAALADASRPTADTLLFHAPLMNVNAATHVCTGSAARPPGSSLGDCEGYERVMYETNFSHVSHPETIAGSMTVSNDDHVRFWRSLSQSKATEFPAKSLVALELTLGEWLAH